MRRVENLQPPLFSDGNNIGKMSAQMFVRQIDFDVFENLKAGVAGAFGREPVAAEWTRGMNRLVPVLLTGGGRELRHPRDDRAYTRRGLEDMVKAAALDYETAVGAYEEGSRRRLPWNIAWGPLVQGLSYGRQPGREPRYDRFYSDHRGHRNLFPVDKKVDAVEETARFAGWLRGASAFPVLVKAIEKSTSAGGLNSPYTRVDLWALAHKTRSPGRADRMIRLVRYAANTHLEKFGLRVRLSTVAASVAATVKINRGGLKAAAATINGQLQYLTGNSFSGKYWQILTKARGLREALAAPVAQLVWAISRVEAGEFPCLREAMGVGAARGRRDTTDGVARRLDGGQAVRKHGIVATPGYVAPARRQRWRSPPTWLVRGSGRTFHATCAWRAEEAIRHAMHAWTEQRRLERAARLAHGALVSFLEGKMGFCPIVRRPDSYRAGNCDPGTESWLRSHGWSGRAWVPGAWLIPHLGDYRVRNVVTRLREETARLMA